MVMVTLLNGNCYGWIRKQKINLFTIFQVATVCLNSQWPLNLHDENGNPHICQNKYDCQDGYKTPPSPLSLLKMDSHVDDNIQRR